MLHDDISNWIKNYANDAGMTSLVVGISGGIDSSVVSALCALTGIKTIVVQMPIKQRKELDDRSTLHANWLLDRYDNVEHINIDLTPAFNSFKSLLNPIAGQSNLAWANSRSRLRMMTLYQIAQCNQGIVVGTGNKVEDFGVGFFTKYGDGGVDISPIADCFKSEVWDMGRALGIEQEIIDAAPTDGLWDDGRNDEEQLGLSYAELERAMILAEEPPVQYGHDDAEKALLEQYLKIRKPNVHKMVPIPIYKKA